MDYKATLTKILADMDVGKSILIPFRIDFADGELEIEKHKTCDSSNTDCYVISFEYQSMYSHHISRFLYSSQEVISYLEGLNDSVLVYDDRLMTKKEFEGHKLAYECIYGICGREKEVCYICMELTYGHKTKCGHDICYKCYHRSIVMNRNNTPNSFQCGVCRKKELEYEDDSECEEEDSDGE